MLKRIDRIRRKLRNWNELKRKAQIFPIAKIRLGTTGCDWVIPDNFLNENSVCYLVGAGEDISFDCEVAQVFGSEIVTIDPTPRAKAHFDMLVENTKKGVETSLYGGNYTYAATQKILSRITFLPYGLWSEKDILRFYKPANEAHVSHSIVNLQKTTEFIEVSVVRLKSLMKQNGHSDLDLLKLDIEGAEYKVIDSIIEDKIKIRVLCIEFDEIHTQLDDKYLHRIKTCMEKLFAFGYILVDLDYKYNMTFMLKDEYTKFVSEKGYQSKVGHPCYLTS